MKKTLIIGIDSDDLLNKIADILDEKFASNTLVKEEQRKIKYLTRIEVSKLLKISLPTLHSWSKHGILKPHKLGNRVLFKEEEIESALTGISNIKHKRNIL